MNFKQNLIDFLTVFTGMRKTLIMIGLILIAIIFRVNGLLNGDQMTDLLKSTTIAFFTSNSVEHVGLTLRAMINNKGKKVEEVVPAPEDNSNGST